MLGIIGAMDVEVNSIKSELENVEIKNIAAMDFYKGTLAGKEVVVVKCGVGKVNAAICAQSSFVMTFLFPIWSPPCFNYLFSVVINQAAF